MNIVVSNKKVSLTPKDYLGEGGEAKVYHRGGIVYKIYHDEGKTLPQKKIEELAKISSDFAIKPINSIFNVDGKLVGYTMKYISDAWNFCQLFSQQFKKDEKISFNDLLDLAKIFRRELLSIHKDKCLIVDLNEMNVLVKNKEIYFIDLDSSQTPSFKATAIMESISDPLAVHNNFTENSDWFSWGILTFNSLTNIHPYQGGHKNYKPKDWLERKKKAVSVFDKEALLPNNVIPFNNIPAKLRDWYEQEFQLNQRSFPPDWDAQQVSVKIKPIVTISHDKLVIKRLLKLDDDIDKVFSFYGQHYFLSGVKLYNINGQEVKEIEWNFKYLDILQIDGETIYFISQDGKNHDVYFRGKLVEKIQGKIFSYNNIIYCANNRFIEYKPIIVNNKLFFEHKVLEDVQNDNTLQVFRGLIVQNLLGKIYISYPNKSGQTLNLLCHDLDRHKILDGKAENGYIFIHSESGGKYYESLICAGSGQLSFKEKKEVDSYERVNYTVTDAGLVLKILKDNIYIYSKGVLRAEIPKIPISSDDNLFFMSGKVCVVRDNEIYSISNQ